MARNTKSATLPSNLRHHPPPSTEENETFFSKLKKKLRFKKGKYHVDINTGECENVNPVSFKKRSSSELLDPDQPLKHGVGRSSERSARSESPTSNKPTTRSQSERFVSGQILSSRPTHERKTSNPVYSDIRYPQMTSSDAFKSGGKTKADNYIKSSKSDTMNKGNEYSVMKFDKEDPVIQRPLQLDVDEALKNDSVMHDDSAIDLDHFDGDTTAPHTAADKPIKFDPGYEHLPCRQTENIISNGPKIASGKTTVEKSTPTSNHSESSFEFDPHYESVNEVKKKMKENFLTPSEEGKSFTPFSEITSKSVESLDDPRYQSIRDVKKKMENSANNSRKPFKTYDVSKSIESLDEPGYESLNDVKKRISKNFQNVELSLPTEQKNQSVENTDCKDTGNLDDSAVSFSMGNENVGGTMLSETKPHSEDERPDHRLTDSSVSRDSGIDNKLGKSQENIDCLYSTVKKKSVEEGDKGSTDTKTKVMEDSNTVTVDTVIKKEKEEGFVQPLVPPDQRAKVTEYDSETELILDPGYAECADAIKGFPPYHAFSDGSESKISSCTSLDLSAEDFPPEPGYAECADAIKSGAIKKISVSHEKLIIEDDVKLRSEHSSEIYANPQILFKKRSKLIERASGELSPSGTCSDNDVIGSMESLDSNSALTLTGDFDNEAIKEDKSSPEAPPLPARNYSLYLESDDAAEFVPEDMDKLSVSDDAFEMDGSITENAFKSVSETVDTLSNSLNEQVRTHSESFDVHADLQIDGNCEGSENQDIVTACVTGEGMKEDLESVVKTGKEEVSQNYADDFKSERENTSEICADIVDDKTASQNCVDDKANNENASQHCDKSDSELASGLLTCPGTNNTTEGDADDKSGGEQAAMTGTTAYEGVPSEDECVHITVCDKEGNTKVLTVIDKHASLPNEIKRRKSDAQMRTRDPEEQITPESDSRTKDTDSVEQIQNSRSQMVSVGQIQPESDCRGKLVEGADDGGCHIVDNSITGTHKAYHGVVTNTSHDSLNSAANNHSESASNQTPDSSNKNAGHNVDSDCHLHIIPTCAVQLSDSNNRGDGMGTSGQVTQSESIPAGAGGQVTQSESIPVGAGGQVTQSESILAGTGGQVTQSESILAGTGGQVTQSKSIPAGTGGQVTQSESILAGTGGQVTQSESILAGTGGQVTQSENIPVKMTSSLDVVQPVKMYSISWDSDEEFQGTEHLPKLEIVESDSENVFDSSDNSGRLVNVSVDDTKVANTKVDVTKVVNCINVHDECVVNCTIDDVGTAGRHEKDLKMCSESVKVTNVSPCQTNVHFDEIDSGNNVFDTPDEGYTVDGSVNAMKSDIVEQSTGECVNKMEQVVDDLEKVTSSSEREDGTCGKCNTEDGEDNGENVLGARSGLPTLNNKFDSALLYEDGEPTHMSLTEIMTLSSASDSVLIANSPSSKTSASMSSENSEQSSIPHGQSCEGLPLESETPPPRPPSYNSGQSKDRNSSSSQSGQSSANSPQDDILPGFRFAERTHSDVEEAPPAIPPRSRIKKIQHQRRDSATQDFMESMRQLKDCGWYWGPLSWEEAEQKLSNKPEGTFLVRDSSDERYILSLSFKNQGRVHHTRIEHHRGHFSFWSQPDSHGKSTIKEFIEQCVTNSENGRFLYFIRPSGPGSPPMPIHLLYPVSRFVQMQSLQHMCRFRILQMVRRDHIEDLPVPTRIKQYLKQAQYYVEYLDD